MWQQFSLLVSDPTDCCIWSGFLEKSGDFLRSRGEKKGGGVSSRGRAMLGGPKLNFKCGLLFTWAWLTAPTASFYPLSVTPTISAVLLWSVSSLKAWKLGNVFLGRVTARRDHVEKRSGWPTFYQLLPVGFNTYTHKGLMTNTFLCFKL